MTVAHPGRSDSRARIIEAAARLLRTDGPAAVTTRGVAEAAGVQAPAIYRLFGDKDGLLDAVAEQVMADFVAGKAADVDDAEAEDVDPLTDLRRSWDRQIAFGIENPSLFRLLSDPSRVRASAAARAGRQVLVTRIQRLARTGRLRVAEQHAVHLVQAAGIGTIQTLLGLPESERDPALADTMFDAVIGQIITDHPPVPGSTDRSAVVAFRAVAPHLAALTPAERQLVVEWTDRAIASTP